MVASKKYSKYKVLFPFIAVSVVAIAAFYFGSIIGKTPNSQSEQKITTTPSPSQTVAIEYFNNPQTIALLFYQDFIQFSDSAYTDSAYSFRDSIFLTEKFKNNHPNFMCASNFPKNITVDSKKISEQEKTAKIVLNHHYISSGNIQIQVNMVFDNTDGRWKIDSTVCLNEDFNNTSQ